MQTRKLYYEDCHIREFTARVESATPTEHGWQIRLDATAFYPGGGGQACDVGYLDDVKVLETFGEDEIIHLCDGKLEPGQTVTGRIDYDRRFDLMQQHTGEHILSGVVHRRYGYHNTGFHVGADMLTVDFDGVIPQEDLDSIEREVNQALWENVILECWVPEPEELPRVFYRTKRELSWPVRIVRVPGWDSCACCGIHVAATGEVGLVKIFSAIGFRGGTRLEMACGGRALAMLNENFRQNREVSQAFSAQLHQTGQAARQMNELLEKQKSQAQQLRLRLFDCIAQGYEGRENVLHFESQEDALGVRLLADAIAGKLSGTAAVFSGEDGKGYAFCLVSRTGDLRELTRAMTAVLHGRGGGKPICQQGRVEATKAEIEAFFENQI